MPENFSGSTRSGIGNVDSPPLTPGNYYTIRGKVVEGDNSAMHAGGMITSDHPIKVKLKSLVAGARGEMYYIVELPEGGEIAVIDAAVVMTAWEGQPSNFSSPTGQATESEGVVIANFSMDNVAEFKENRVRRKAKIFKLGSYPDIQTAKGVKKGISINEDDAKAAIASFTSPIPLDLEHIPTVLNGRLGQLEKLTGIEADEKGEKWITGEFSLEKWFDDVVPNEEKRVSAQWNTETKKLIGCSVVVNPRIKGAEVTQDDLFSEFVAAFNAAQAAPASKGGAPATQQQPPYAAGAASQHGPALWQQLCDIASGALKNTDENTHNKKYISELSKVVDICVKNGAKGQKSQEPASDDTGTDNTKTTTSTTFSAGDADMDLTKNQEYLSLKKRLEDTEKELASNRKLTEAATRRAIEAEAASFADSLMPGNGDKIFPAERNAVIEAYVQAAVDDANAASFSADGKPITPRVNALRKLYSDRPKLAVLGGSRGGESRVVPADFSAANGPKDQPTPAGQTPSKERLEYLRSLTPLGKISVSN